MTERDEWTMVCPPGRTAEAEEIEGRSGVYVREIIESPVAGDQFLLINDAQLDAFWAHANALPVQVSHPAYDREVIWIGHALVPTDMVKVTGI